MEPISDTAKVAKTLRLDGSKGKSTTIILLKEHSNKMTPNDIMLYSWIGPAADGNKYIDPQPDIILNVKDIVTLSPKYGVFIICLSSRLRTSQGRGSRKSLIARGNKEN